MSEDFKARLFETDATEARVVSLQLSSQGLYIKEIDANLSLDDLTIEASGHAGDRFKIVDRKSGRVLITHDDQLLEQLKNSGSSAVTKLAHEAQKSVKHRHSRFKRYWLKVSAALILLLVGAALAMDPLEAALVASIDRKLETKIAELLPKPESEEKNSEQSKRVHRIGKRLVAQIDNCPYTFHFQMKEDPEINAFAYPAGFVYVNSGLLDAVKSDDELAGVMGHEIGHVMHRDVLRAAVRRAGLLSSISIITGAGAGSETADTVANMLSMAEGLESLNFSRKQEAAADIEGIKLVTKADYKAEAFIDFFQRLESDKKTKDVAMLAIISSHPMNKERIEIIREEVARLQKETSTKEKTTKEKTTK